MPEAYLSGIGTIPLGTYDVPERELATQVTREASADAGIELSDIDGIVSEIAIADTLQSVGGKSPIPNGPDHHRSPWRFFW